MVFIRDGIYPQGYLHQSASIIYKEKASISILQRKKANIKKYMYIKQKIGKYIKIELASNIKIENQVSICKINEYRSVYELVYELSAVPLEEDDQMDLPPKKTEKMSIPLTPPYNAFLH